MDAKKMVSALLEEIERSCEDRGSDMTPDELRGYVHGLATAALSVIELGCKS